MRERTHKKSVQLLAVDIYLPEDEDNIIPTVTFYRTAAYPSAITLPVIPAE